MAIAINLNKTERILFCASKWWGDPDMPETMEYPTVEVTEDGETYDYPLTFLCQINCEDIAAMDKTGLLPKEGMLYFFAAIDKWIGYESPTSNGAGEWPKGYVSVKYAKSINFETFRSSVMVDEDDLSVAEPELEMTFVECADDAAGHKILGVPAYEEVVKEYPDMLNLLQIEISSDTKLCLMMKESDLKFGNWKRAKAFLLSR